MATREEIKSIIGYMILAYPNFKPDTTSRPNTVDVYEDLLGDIDGETLQMATKAACMEDRGFAPAPGEIRAAMHRLPERFRIVAPTIKRIESVEVDLDRPFFEQFPRETV